MLCTRIPAIFIISFFPGLPGIPAAAATDEPGLSEIRADAAFADEIVPRLLRGEYDTLRDAFADMEHRFLAGDLREGALSMAWEAFGNSNPAIGVALDAWVSTDPKSFVPYVARGEYLHHLGWIARSEKAVRELRSGQLQAAARYFPIAARDYRAALDRNPKLGIVYGRLIDMAMVFGGDTYAFYSLAVREVPTATYPREAYRHAQRPEWRGSGFDMQIDVEPEDPAGVAFQKGRTAQIRGNPILAEALFDEAIAHAPRAGYYYYRGWSRRSQKNYVMAQRDFERAAEWMPRNAAAFDALAGTKTKQGEWLAATHDWERALEIDSYHPRHLLYYAQALLYASSEIVTVPQPEAPPNLEAPEARCNADAGKPMSMKWNGMHVPRTAVMWRHQCRVMEVLDRALLYGADDSDVRYVRGFHFMTRLARPDLAAEEFRRSVELEPRNSENWNLYGQALYEAEPCRAVPVMIHYLRMCTVVSTCQSDELVPIWLDDIVKNAGCSDEVTSAAAQYKPFWEKRSSAEPASGR